MERPTYPTRRHTAHGVLPSPHQPTIVFLTVCTKDRSPWLTNPGVHTLLRGIWEEASTWLVGRYVLMPDHLHLFAAPGEREIALENWVRYWKSRFRVLDACSDRLWQSSFWDTRLRASESYERKWDYVRNNPVRKSLVLRPEEWEFQGTIHELTW